MIFFLRGWSAGLGIAARGLALAIVLCAAAPARAAPDRLLEFLEKCRCPVADRLQRLYDAGDPAQNRDRDLVVALPEPCARAVAAMVPSAAPMARPARLASIMASA